MRVWRRKKFWPLIPCLIIVSFELYYWMKQPPIPPKIKRVTDPCKGEIANDTITVFGYNKIFIISAYHDNRQQNLTRMIAIVHYEKVQDLYCWFCCSHNGRISIIRATVDIHSDRLGFPFGTADILCLEPEGCSPKYVSIHRSPRGKVDEMARYKIKNRVEKSSFAMEFTVCLSVMFGNYNNVLQFIQSIEMYKILGVQKVLIYLNSCSQLMEQVVNLYVAEGTIEIVPWPITSFFKISSFWQDHEGIRHYGQTTVLNDCIYRNMYKSKYVLLNDIDEIILPIKHQDWNTMMNNLQDQNPGTDIFLFENHIYPHTVLSSTRTFNISFWNIVPGVNILQHIYREPNIPGDYNPRKMIVNPRKIVQTSVDSILKGYGGTLKVSSDIAIVYHCRKQVRHEISENYLIRDTTIWRYNGSLINNVNQFLKKQFPERNLKNYLKTLFQNILLQIKYYSSSMLIFLA